MNEFEDLDIDGNLKSLDRKPEEDLNQKVGDLNAKINYMLSRMHLMVKEEVNSVLNKEGFKQFAVDLITKEMRSNFSEYLKKVIDLTLTSMSKRIKNEVRVSKDLIGALEGDIKRIVRDIPVSYEYERKIETELRKKMELICSDISQTLLEKKEDKRLLE